MKQKPSLEFSLSKRYGDFDLNVAGRIGPEWLVMLAPSGAGKSLTLSLIAGLVKPDGGFVRLGGDTLYDGTAGIWTPIRRRRIGYAFQSYALFPHMTVSANIAYGLPPAREGGREVSHWLEFFHLRDKAAAYPGELSGGQQQRVALARALASGPRALLLDEPLSALDPRIRLGLQQELAALKSTLSIPVVLVTHDFNEAQVLGDQVIVLDGGAMVESGEKSRIFARPRRNETARFMGVENVIAARTVRLGKAGKTHTLVRTEGFQARVASQSERPAMENGFLCIRAADVRLAVDRKKRPNLFSARVVGVTPLAGSNLLRLAGEELGGTELAMLVDDYVLGRYKLEPGGVIRFWLPPEKIFLCE